MSFETLLTNLVGLFLLIAVGFAAVRGRIIPAEASRPLSALLLKITLPATIFTSMVRPFDPSFVRDSVTIFLLGMVCFLSYGALSLGAARLCRVPEGRRGIWSFCATFCNNGFMGYPVAQALFGSEGLALAVILGIPFNLLVYTMGAKMVCLDRPKDGTAPGLSIRSALVSPINASILLGLAAYCLQLPVPEMVMMPLGHLSNVTTPLSMFVTGMNLAQGRAADILRDRDAFTSTALRLLILPLLTAGALRLLPISGELVKGVTLVILSMPAPAVATILAEQYRGNTELGARIVFLSSLLCIVTIPLMTLLL